MPFQLVGKSDPAVKTEAQESSPRCGKLSDTAAIVLDKNPMERREALHEGSLKQTNGAGSRGNLLTSTPNPYEISPVLREVCVGRFELTQSLVEIEQLNDSFIAIRFNQFFGDPRQACQVICRPRNTREFRFGLIKVVRSPFTHRSCDMASNNA